MDISKPLGRDEATFFSCRDPSGLKKPFLEPITLGEEEAVGVVAEIPNSVRCCMVREESWRDTTKLSLFPS